MPDAFAEFNGIRRFISGSYTVGWGTSPGQARLSVGAGFGGVGAIGDLKFHYRGDSFTLHDAIVVDPSSSGGVGEAPRIDFVALDRRWKWQYCGAVSGDFNRDAPDGALIRPASPRDLAARLFDALGEKNVDVNALPAGPRPRVVWDAASPREELNRLLADFGCAVCFNPVQNRVYVVQIGVGGQPPAMGHISRSDADVWPVPPDGVRLVGGPTLFQTALALGEAVGREVDGSYVPIDKLSYAPPDGWKSLPPWQFEGLEGEYTDPATGETLYHRDLAQASVWRCYRLSGQAAGGFTPALLKNEPVAPQSLADLGPFTGALLDKDPQYGERLPCYVRGTFADERLGEENSNPHTRFPGSVSIDGEQYVVAFDRPLFMYDDDKNVTAADVVLIAAYACSHEGVPIRHWRAAPTGYNVGAGELVEHRPDAVREVVEKNASSTGKARDNRAAVDAELDYHLAATVARYQDATATQATYGGLALAGQLALDGRCRSITYQFSAHGAPTTSASWNCERSPYVIPWEQRPEARAARQADYAVRRAAAQASVAASRQAVRMQSQ